MKYLLINTAVPISVILLVEDSKVISKAEENNSKDLSAKIFSMIDQVFKNANMSPQDLNKIFVVNGPGSFTGIRIGVTIAKVMAWSLKIDLIPISSLEVLASSNISYDVSYPLIDARRNFVFAGGYDCNLNLTMPNQYIHIDELLKKTCDNSNVIFIGYDSFENIHVEKPTPDYLKVIKKHEYDKVTNCHSVNPVYLKLTEAEEKRILNEY